MRFEREIPVRHDVDVCVIGGGPAGCAAAVYAARAGASVYLAEASGSFGGMGTIGMVPAFMQFTDGINFNAGGFGREIHDLHKERSGLPDYRHGGCSIDVEILKIIYDELVTNAGVKYSFDTRAFAVEAKDGHISHVIFTNRTARSQNLFAVRAKVFIDCTGTGEISVWSGAYWEVGEELVHEVMPGTLCSLWGDVDWDAFEAWRDADRKNNNVHARLEKAIDENFFEVPDLHLPGVVRFAGHMGGGNVGHAFDLKIEEPDFVTPKMVEQRAALQHWQAFYRKYVPGFANAKVVRTADTLGIRESRRVTCEYTLNANDFRARAVFDDEIGRYSYPVDIHRHTDDKKTYEAFLKEINEDMHYKDGESYGIPYRSLLPVYTDNLLVAGCIIGCDRAIQASVRVMPGCYITGQAAGAAAALSVQDGVALRELPVHKLQGYLKAQGAYLPNYKD